MSLVVVSEYFSTDGHSRVSRDEFKDIYVVECYSQKAIVRREIFTSINPAEDFAEDWVQCH